MIPEKNVAYIQSAVDGDVREAYAQMFKGEFILQDSIMWAEKLKRMTGVSPPVITDERIQEEYRLLIGTGLVGCADELQKITGIKPRFDEQMRDALKRGSDALSESQNRLIDKYIEWIFK